ncbi:hypothetical protein LRH25_10155 [Ideonella azotifigens]|nr:hypothetical protein [Ideonella azotifigens]MCD2340706.1 hypothetical protein [Ideonella azotifigens]
MENSQPMDQPNEAGLESGPVVLDLEVLKQVVGGTGTAAQSMHVDSPLDY